MRGDDYHKIAPLFEKGLDFKNIILILIAVFPV